MLLREIFGCRYLNQITRNVNASLPISDDIFELPDKATVFSKTDLKTEFYQIRARPEDVKKTVSNMKHGQFEYLTFPWDVQSFLLRFSHLVPLINGNIYG